MALNELPIVIETMVILLERIIADVSDADTRYITVLNYSSVSGMNTLP